MTTLHSASGDGQIKTFKTFPEFSKLSYIDKKQYESFMSKYPPIADLSFALLMVWWNSLDSCAIAELNGNLVISYWLPGAEKASGLSIIGDKMVDESICALFDYLREKGEDARLVHVPENVLAYVRYPELFDCREEREFDEYIFAVSQFYPLENSTPHRRKRIYTFLENVHGSVVDVRSLDLSSRAVQRQLLRASSTWQRGDSFKINNIAKIEAEAMQTSIVCGDQLNMECLGLFVGDDLQAYSLHFMPASDLHYITAMHVRMNPDLPNIFDYMLYVVAEHAANRGAQYINMKYDLGIPEIRMFKMALGPTNFFRKFTITSSKGKGKAV